MAREVYPDRGLTRINKKLYRCRKCGFPCNDKPTLKRPGIVLSVAKGTIGVASDISVSAENIIVNKGCPFCGTVRSK